MSTAISRAAHRHRALAAKVVGGVLVYPLQGVYAKPPSGTPLYVLPMGSSDVAALPSDWQWVISDQRYINSPALGIISSVALAGPLWTEVDAGGNPTAGSTPYIDIDGSINHTVPRSISYGRSETGWYDGVNNTNFRPVSGDRLRVSLDFKGSYIAPLIYANANSWFSVHQYLGPTQNNSWPGAPFAVILESGEIRLKGQPGSVRLYGTSAVTYNDATWYRYEEDIVLGGTATGTVSAWINGQPLCTNYKPMLNATTPGHGTYYEGTGNASFDNVFIYLKSGNYCGRDTSLATSDSVVWTRNRRLTWTKTSSGSTTTWRELPVMDGGYHLFWRNSATGIISLVLDA